MSRGGGRGGGGRGGGRGGRGGKPMAPQLKMKGDDDDVDAVTAAAAVNQNWLTPPDRYPVIENLPVFPALTSFDRELAERSRFLNEHFRYSGYFVMKESEQHQADKERAAPENQRYTDRYRRISGRKTFVDEIREPSKLLFPDELLSQSRSSFPRHSYDSFASRAVFLSSRSLAQHVQRLLSTNNNQSGARAASSSSSSSVNEEEGEGGDTEGGGAEGDDEEEGAKKKVKEGGADGEGDDEEDDTVMDQQDEEQEDSDDAGDYGMDHWGNDEDDPQAFDDKDDSDGGEAEM